MFASVSFKLIKENGKLVCTGYMVEKDLRSFLWGAGKNGCDGYRASRIIYVKDGKEHTILYKDVIRDET